MDENSGIEVTSRRRQVIASERFRYATIGRRSLALWIDALVMLPLALGFLVPMAMSREWQFALTVPWAFVASAYFVMCHRLWGQTLGKYWMGVKVVSLDGGLLTWRQAALRSLPELVLGVTRCGVSLVLWMRPPDAPEYVDPFHVRLFEFTISWTGWEMAIDTAYAGWILGEVVVALTNPQRRAIHDLIAGSVVVRMLTKRERVRAIGPTPSRAQVE